MNDNQQVYENVVIDGNGKSFYGDVFINCIVSLDGTVAILNCVFQGGEVILNDADGVVQMGCIFECKLRGAGWGEWFPGARISK